MNIKRFPIFVFFAFLIIALNACGSTPSTPFPPSMIPTMSPTKAITSTPTLTYTPLSTSTSTIIPSPTPITIRNGHVVVKVGAPAHINFGWVAATEELTQDFLDGFRITMTIDGKSIPETELKKYWGPITEYHSEDTDGFSVYWTYPLENNPIFQTPGIYRIEIRRVFTKNVTDGFLDSETNKPIWFYAGDRLSPSSIEVEILP